MSLQVIKSATGEPEYVLLPVRVYKLCQRYIDQALSNESDEYDTFVLEDYVSNPVALARINARLNQQVLAELMGVTQAYISKIENQSKVSHGVMAKVTAAIAAGKARQAASSTIKSSASSRLRKKPR